MRYWRTYQKTLIRKILNKAKQVSCPFIMWQQLGSSRKVYDVAFEGLSKSEISFHINKSSLAKMGAVDKEQPVYFHIKELDVIFKKDKFNSFMSSLKATLPNELQIYERRRTMRFYYKYQDHKNITFESASRKADNEKEPEFTLSSVLVDISTAGAGMVVSKSTKDRLYQGFQLRLLNLTDQELPKPFAVRVSNIGYYDKLEDDELYKVGLEFDEELDAISYKSINSVIEKKAKRIAGLDRDRFCGLDLEEQHRILTSIESFNKQLAINIREANEYLDRLRYMTTKMKIEFLQNVSHELLATALRLSSKELIYDLFIELTDNIREEFLDKLEKEKPASAVNKAQDQVIKYLREKEATGEFVLDPSAFETYV